MVLIYHGAAMFPAPIPWLTPITNYGQYGVDLFFVLSGWLIGGLYWRERYLFGELHIVHFWIRRWMRTVPPYVAALSISWFAVRYMRREPFDYGYLFFMQNYYEALPFFVVSWSLCVEEHFYLIIPLAFVFWKCNQDRTVYFLAVLALIVPCSFRFLEYPHNGSEFGYPVTATHLRMEGLLLGFFLSYVSTYVPVDFRTLQRASPYVVASSIIFMIFLGFADAWIRYTFWGTAVAVFFSSVLAWTVSCQEIRAGNCLITSVAITSYSIYLTHALAIHIARVFSMQFSEAAAVAYLPIMLTFVAASSITFYYGVERTSIIVRDTYWPRRRVTTRERRVTAKGG